MKCSVDEKCEAEAVFTFTWPWGSPGACCGHHLVIAQQRSQQTRGRFGAVSFVPLNPDRPREITRDERIELHSARLTAESERDDARLRANKLLDANTQLSNDLRIHKTRCAQLEAQAKELRERVEYVIRERDQALLVAAKAREALEHLGGELDDAPKTEPPPRLPAHL